MVLQFLQNIDWFSFLIGWTLCAYLYQLPQSYRYALTHKTPFRFLLVSIFMSPIMPIVMLFVKDKK